MPKNVEIEIFRIAHTKVDGAAVHKWLERLGADEFTIPREVSDPALLTALAAKRCYSSFQVGLNPNVTKVRKNYVEYLDNILRQGHGKVLEHATYSYAIEGLSRICTAELNRHAAGWTQAEASFRYIRFEDDISFWMPNSLREDPADDAELTDKKLMSRTIFKMAFSSIETYYDQLLKIWDMDGADKNFHYKKKVTSCLRRIVPMGVATGGVWTGNIRALRHVLALRTDPSAEEEIAYVFGLIGEDIIKREPLLFGDFIKTEDGAFVPAYAKV